MTLKLEFKIRIAGNALTSTFTMLWLSNHFIYRGRLIRELKEGLKPRLHRANVSGFKVLSLPLPILLAARFASPLFSRRWNACMQAIESRI